MVGGGQKEVSRNNPVNLFRRLLSDQQESISQLLAEQRQELFEKVEKSKNHKFRQRVLEKQYEVNEEFCNISRCVQSALKKGHIEKAAAKIEELTEDLEAHGEDIIAADLSRHGWLTVQRLRNKSSLSSSLLKQLEKEDEAIDKNKKKAFIQDGRFGGRSRTMDGGPFKDSVRTVRSGGAFQKKSPEQLLEEAVKQNRAGQCGHCQEECHFYRECPSFWEKVKESRKAFKK